MKISVNNLKMTYPDGKKALHDISVHIENSSLIGLLEPNGAGKSTLMKLFIGGLK